MENSSQDRTPKPVEHETIPDILFTGTNLEFAERMYEKHHSYRQETDGRPTHLSQDPLIAFNSAIFQGHKHDATPVLLVIKRDAGNIKIERSSVMGHTDDFHTDEIPPECIIASYKVTPMDASKFLFLKDPVKELAEQLERVEFIPKENTSGE